MQSTIEAAGIRSHLQRCFRRPPRPPWVRVRPTCERRGRGKQQEVSETAALQLDGQEASSEDVSGRKPCLGHPGPQGSCLYRCRQVSVPRPWWSHEVTRGDTGPFTARNRAFNIVAPYTKPTRYWPARVPRHKWTSIALNRRRRTMRRCCCCNTRATAGTGDPPRRARLARLARG